MSIKFFYMIEDGKAVGQMCGSEEKGDGTSVKEYLDAWVEEKKDTRSVVAKDVPVSSTADLSEVVFHGGDVRLATEEEIIEMEVAKHEALESRLADRRSFMSKLAVLGFTNDEIESVFGRIE